MFKPHKIVIIGLGHVGSAVLSCAIECQLAADIACIDIRKDVAHGEALDAAHALACSYVPGIHVHSGNFEECQDADVIICDAGPSMLPGQKMDRLCLAGENIAVIRSIMEEVTQYTRDAVFIMVTNPLDITTYVAATEFAYPEGRLFGTGTLLETMRLKSIIGERYCVNSSDVQGYMLGEHGNSAFPAWSTVSIGGVPLQQLDEFYDYDEDLDLEEISRKVVCTAYDVLQSKGWTNTGIAMGVCRVVKAVLFDERAVMPVSMPLKGEYGLKDVALSIPSIIGRHGVEKRIPLRLTGNEMELFKKSAEAVKEVLISNGVVK